jgi:hypothetical protein
MFYVVVLTWLVLVITCRKQAVLLDRVIVTIIYVAQASVLMMYIVLYICLYRDFKAVVGMKTSVQSRSKVLFAEEDKTEKAHVEIDGD